MPSSTHDLRALQRLLEARHACISIVSTEETYVLELINIASLSLSKRVASWSSTRGVVDGSLESHDMSPR